MSNAVVLANTALCAASTCYNPYLSGLLQLYWRPKVLVLLHGCGSQISRPFAVLSALRPPLIGM